MVEVECGGFVFTSNFESGNLARVEQVPLPPKPSTTPNSQQPSSACDTPDYEFSVWTNPDCAGTEFENGNRSWFYFGVRGGTPFSLVKINLVNLNRQVKMYSQGMAPVFRVLPGRGIWDRIRDKPTYTMEDNVFTLSFRFRAQENSKVTTYFAFTFPYSYQDLMSSLKGFDKRFKSNPPPEKYLPGQFTSGLSPDDIYYHRELAIHSLDGRRLDLLTISSHHGITSVREPRFKNLFPDPEALRPYMFLGKKVIFVSARVHPGEVPSSYVLNGLIEALLNRDDLTSVLLRRMYVFKIIPMLNPDGVARGHFRTDTRGVNLNRVYITPSLQYHPTIYAARAIIKFAHYGKEVPDEEESPDVKCANGPSAPVRPSASANQVRVARRAVSIQRTQSTHSLPQSTLFSTTSVHSLRPTASLPQSLQAAHAHRPDAAPKSPGNPAAAEDPVKPPECDAIEMDVERTKDDDEAAKKKSFCAAFPSESVLPGALKAQPLHESESALRKSPPSGQLKNAQSALELSFRQVMNFSAPKPPSNIAHQCNAEEAHEVVKERKIRRKHHAVGSSRLVKRHVSRCNEEDLTEDAARVSCFHDTAPVVVPVKTPMDSSKSGLFLYMDMHGHASKKGIFMYGNHFDDIDQLVECMLLPKIMSINSQNFHFNACNFTERNMYLRDRRDGMSREGCGRVAVMKMTRLVRSYTLECNYNTGRIVNLLPPCVRDYTRMAVNVAYAVPPKYTPLVFEDVGRALAVSILDITNSNPCSRIPNSDYRTVNGIREWLRSNCMSDNQMWTRMLHRPTRQTPQQQQTSQSSLGSAPGMPRPKLSVNAAKSTLLARIPTDLNQLGDEDAGKENTGTQFQKATSGGLLVDKEADNVTIAAGGSASPPSAIDCEPKENITPQGVTVAAPITSPAPSRPGTSNSGQSRTRRRLRAVSHVKIRRSVCSAEGAMLDSPTGNTGGSATSSGTPSHVEIRLNAAPKRPKVSAKVPSKPRRKQMAWTSTDDQQADGQSKAVLLTKLEKQSLRGEKLRAGTLVKTKKLVPQQSTSLGESSKSPAVKLDVSQGFVNFVGKLSTAKDVKTGVASGKPSASMSVDKEWIRAKNSARFNKVLKPDSEPSTSEPSCSSVTCGSKVDVKLKSAVLRSLEKGSKSRLLCPMRRRSNEGKKAWKSLERKSDN